MDSYSGHPEQLSDTLGQVPCPGLDSCKAMRHETYGETYGDVSSALIEFSCTNAERAHGGLDTCQGVKGSTEGCVLMLNRSRIKSVISVLGSDSI